MWVAKFQPLGQNCVQMLYPSARFVCQMPLPKNKSFWWVVELLCGSWNKSFASVPPRSLRCNNLLSAGCKTRQATDYKWPSLNLSTVWYRLLLVIFHKVFFSFTVQWLFLKAPQTPTILRSVKRLDFKIYILISSGMKHAIKSKKY